MVIRSLPTAVCLARLLVRPLPLRQALLRNPRYLLRRLLLHTSVGLASVVEGRELVDRVGPEAKVDQKRRHQ